MTWTRPTTAAAVLAFAACACGAGALTARSGPSVSTPDHAPVAAAHSVNRPTLLPDQLTVPLERHGEHLFARAAVDGREVGHFLVDTGASLTIIDVGLADALRLPEVVETEVGGIHAPENGTLRQLARLSIGGVELASETTVALPLDDLSVQTGVPVAGIVGFPTLGPVPFTIDFAAATLTFYNREHFTPPAQVESALLRVHQNAPFVETTLESSGEAWLMLDSGAAASVVLWRSYVAQFPDVLTVPQKRWAVSMGSGGGTQVMVSELRSLRLFGQELPHVTTMIQDAPPWMWKHPRAAGIVGLEVLRRFRVTIDPDRHRIWAESR